MKMRKIHHVFAILFACIGGFSCQDKLPSVTGSGTVEATDIVLSAGVASEIMEAPIEEGRKVEKGDLIVALDTENFVLERDVVAAGLIEIDASESQTNAQISQAQTSLDGAKKNYNRAVELKSKGSISLQQFDDAFTSFSLAQKQVETAKTALDVIKARRQSLEAKLKVLDWQISEGRIVSPISGVALEKFVEVGERIIPGKSIVKLARLDQVWVKIYISEKDLGKVKLNAKAKILVDSHPDEVFDGRVSWVTSTAEFTPKNVQTRDARADLVYAVKVVIDNPQSIFKIGMPVDVLLEGFPEFTRDGRS